MLPVYLHLPFHFSIIPVNALTTAGEHGIHDPRTRYRPRSRLRGTHACTHATLCFTSMLFTCLFIYYCTRSHSAYTRLPHFISLLSLPQFSFFTIASSTSTQISYFSLLSALLSHHCHCIA
jgi:hypothetical protein